MDLLSSHPNPNVFPAPPTAKPVLSPTTILHVVSVKQTSKLTPMECVSNVILIVIHAQGLQQTVQTVMKDNFWSRLEDRKPVNLIYHVKLGTVLDVQIYLKMCVMSVSMEPLNIKGTVLDVDFRLENASIQLMMYISTK